MSISPDVGRMKRELAALVAIDTQNPPGHETLAAHYVRDLLIAGREEVEPDGFDLTAERGGARLLTFGAGIHYCVGANLARAEMQEGLAFLAERVSSLAVDGEPEFGTPSGIYGLETLPLKLDLA